MTDKDRLIELLLKSEPIKERDLDDDWFDGEIEDIADYLLANGVIVPPCKVGDKVYVVDKIRSGHFEESRYVIDDEGEWKIYERDFNLVLYAAGDFFLTKEEAEAELRKRCEDNGNL